MCLAMLALKGHQGQAAEDTSHHPSGPCKLFYKKKVTPMGFSARSGGADGLSCPSVELTDPTQPSEHLPTLGVLQVGLAGERRETPTTAAPALTWYRNLWLNCCMAPWSWFRWDCHCS